MSCLLSVLICLIQNPAAPDSEEIAFISLIDRMDREMSGLFDGYLEAVPECPVLEDTPIRIWLLDLAWLRASGTLTTARAFSSPDDADLEEVWHTYIATSANYLKCFRHVRNIYARGFLPDTSLSIDLERMLFNADSIWQLSEEALLNTFAEKEP